MTDRNGSFRVAKNIRIPPPPSRSRDLGNPPHPPNLKFRPSRENPDVPGFSLSRHTACSKIGFVIANSRARNGDTPVYRFGSLLPRARGRRRTSSQGWPNWDEMVRNGGRTSPTAILPSERTDDVLKEASAMALMTAPKVHSHWPAISTRWRDANANLFERRGTRPAVRNRWTSILMANRSSCAVLVPRRYEGDVRMGGILECRILIILRLWDWYNMIRQGNEFHIIFLLVNNWKKIVLY